MSFKLPTASDDRLMHEICTWFKKVFGNQKHSYFLVNGDGDLIDFSQAAENSSIYSKENLLGKSILDLNLLCENDLYSLREILNRDVEHKDDVFFLISVQYNDDCKELNIHSIKKTCQKVIPRCPGDLCNDQGAGKSPIECWEMVNANIKDLQILRQEEETEDSAEIPYKKTWLASIFNSVAFGVIVIDPEKHRIAAVNRAASDLIGIPARDIVGQECWQFICPAQKNRCPFTNLNLKIMNDERVLKNYKGESIPIIKSVVPVMIKDKQYLVESFIDISDKKETQKRMRFLRNYDHLTGLHNRVSFNKQIRRLIKNDPDDLGIIVCDIDGLKTINDAFGNGQGDMLLKQLARLLNKAVTEADIVARIGADEFAILLTGCNEQTIQTVCERIQREVAQYNEKSELILSVSLGYGIAASGEGYDSEKLLKQAEDNMYREKLLHRRSASSAIVSTLTNALGERDFITGGHADRLQQMMEVMARHIGLPDHHIASLLILAQFHDIGKIGIPDAILNKPGVLTEEERKVMQQHCQIGYRIARSASVLHDIADWILMHHEWWDGTGYPLGLKGDEIPLECRMLSIVDAYDAMTSDRPYRKAMTVDKAREELEQGAGSQFDPNLTGIFIDLIKEAVI